SGVETGNETIVDIAGMRDPIQKYFENFSNQGCRTLGVAYKNMESRSSIRKDDEIGMTFLGFLVLFDPPKANIADTIGQLKNLGVSLKVITGDNPLVAANVSRQMGLSETKIIAGPDLGQLSEYAEVCVYGHERQFRKHVQYGRTIPLHSVSPVAAQADLAHQSNDRFSGDDNRNRQRRQGNGRLSPALGHQSHSQVYDDLRSDEFRVRLPHFWCASAGFSCDSGSIPN